MTTVAHSQRTRNMLTSLEVIHAHLAAYPVTGPVLVCVDALGDLVSVQLGEHDLTGVAVGLVSWADTLTGCTAEAWRVPHGKTVHLSVTGRARAGVAVRVYASVYDNPAVFPDLLPGERQALTLAGLRGWSGGDAT
jgi:hypothetical protein